jgi:transposase
MARPTKLTTEVEEKILKAIRSGNYAEPAALYAGVHRATYFRWMERGDPAGTAPTDRRYRAFRARVEQAKAEAEVRDVTMIAKAGERDWRARAWSLERRHPERWARRAAAEEEGSSLERALAAAGTSYRLAALSEPEQNELARLLDRARVDNPANKGGPVAPLPSFVEIWKVQVVQRLEKNPKQYRRWVTRDLELIRTQPDRYEARLELLDEVAEQLEMAPRPTPETGV